MCVIVYKPLKVELDYTDIDQMWSRNNDGAGLAYFVSVEDSPDMLCHVEKGFMKLSHLKNRLSELFEEIGDVQLAIHFRNATCGGVNEELTHPFAIEKDIDDAIAVLEEEYPAVLMHNGVLPKFGNAEISDTLDFVTSILYYVDPIARPRFLEMLNSKFLLMQNNTFHFCGAWEDYKGLKCSNTHWKWTQPTVYYNPGAELYNGRKKKNKKCGFQSSYSNMYDDNYDQNIIELTDIKEITKDGEVIIDPMKVQEELEKDTWRQFYGDYTD